MSDGDDLVSYCCFGARLAWVTPSGPAFTSDSVSGAYSYTQALLNYLNGTPTFTSKQELGGHDRFRREAPARTDGRADRPALHPSRSGI